MEVRRPPEAALPEEADTVAYLYRNFKYPQDTLLQYYRNDNRLIPDRTYTAAELDSMLAAACLESASAGISGSGLCSRVLVIPVGLMPRQSGDHLTPLPPGLVTRIAGSAGVSALLALETFSAFFSRFTGEVQGDGYQQVVLAGIWTVYDGVTGEVHDRKTMTDTLYWEESDPELRGEAVRLPPRIPSLMMAAGYFGESYASRFSSEWVSVTRMMIIPPLEEFRLASVHAEEQEWEQAARIWKKYAHERFGRLAVTARYNLALASEISDDLESATEWIGQAHQLAGVYKNRREMQMTEEYGKLLQNRRSEILKARGPVQP